MYCALTITPQTLNFLGNTQAYETSGYSATISDVRLMSTFNGVGINNEAAFNANAGATATSTTTLGTNVSTTVIGSQINLRATTINTLFGSNTQLLQSLLLGICFLLVFQIMLFVFTIRSIIAM